MKLSLLVLDVPQVGKSIELPAAITSYHQVKVLAFSEGTMWLAILEPSGAISEDQTPHE